MCVTPSALISPVGAALSGGAKAIGRSGMFGLAGMALAGRKKAKTPRQPETILYSRDGQGLR
jgi:hypothetical protein